MNSLASATLEGSGAANGYKTLYGGVDPPAARKRPPHTGGGPPVRPAPGPVFVLPGAGPQGGEGPEGRSHVVQRRGAMINKLHDHVQEDMKASNSTDTVFLDKLHDHIQEELKTNTRTDTVFIITAILLNLLSLGVNAALTAGGDTSGGVIAVLVTFILLVIVINAIAIIGLAKGRQTRFKLLKGLVTVHPKSTLDGAFRWESLKGPVVLKAGQAYLVGTADRQQVERFNMESTCETL
jgi:hypothetical protein